jgi:hypothetical protein
MRAYAGAGNTVQLNLENGGSTDVSVTTADRGTSLTFHINSTK